VVDPECRRDKSKIIMTVAGHRIVVRLLRWDGRDKVVVGIEAPDEVNVVRGEIEGRVDRVP
jgi:sRNA-binding carbon storage regulator CsrA